MPEMHLRQPRFTCSACGPFTKHKQRIQKFKETGDTKYIYKNKLGKACFAHDAAYSDSKNLTNATAADKLLKDKAFNIAKDLKYDGHQRGLASMVYNFFIKIKSLDVILMLKIIGILILIKKLIIKILNLKLAIM